MSERICQSGTWVMLNIVAFSADTVVQRMTASSDHIIIEEAIFHGTGDGRRRVRARIGDECLEGFARMGDSGSGEWEG